MGSEVGRRLVKAIIAVIGLIVIRIVLDNLPMLKEAQPIYVGSGGSPVANADWANYAQQYFNTGQMPQNYQDIVKKIALPYIFPISIANAIVDTLIFAVLIVTAAGFNGLIRARSKRLPEGGLIILLLVLTIVVAIAYKSYMGVIPPLLGSQANLYGWFFLVLGLLPLIGLIVVASRNLDAITEVVFASTSRVVVGGRPQTTVVESSASCSKCGAKIAAGVKFCDSCGAPVPVATSTGKFCSECGAKNESGAKFCNKCGKSLA
jgi:ribosomal protein L40E